MTGSARTHADRDRVRRRKLRARLAREGWAPELIDAEIERIRFAHLVARHGEEVARELLYRAQPDQPDDRSHRPAYVDPVLRGPARATGQTAAAVRRGRTVTQSQHDDREARS